MRTLLRIAPLTFAFALATVSLSWWSVPVLGAVWGALGPRSSRRALTAAIAAGLGWALLLSWAATQGPVGELAARVGPVFGLPLLGFVGLTLVFPMLLAWSAGTVVEELRKGVGSP